MPILWLYTTENQKDNALEVIQKYTDEYQEKTPKSEGVLEYKVIIDEESEILKAISDMEDISKSWITRERADGFMGLPPKKTKTKYKLISSIEERESSLDADSVSGTSWQKIKEINLGSLLEGILLSDEYNHYVKCVWEHDASGTNPDYGETKIYLSDVATGTTHKTWASDGWTDVTEVLSLGKEIDTSDKIQIYGHHSSTGNISVQNWKLYFSLVEVEVINIYE